MSQYLNAIIVGLAIGSVYGLIGLGYTVVYNATRIVNLAHGQQVMVATLLSYALLAVLHWPEWLAAVTVIASGVVLALIAERIIIRPFVGKASSHDETLGWMVATLAFGLVLTTGAAIIWGNREALAVPSFVSAGFLRAGWIVLQWHLLVPVALLVITTGALHYFYQFSRFGWALRATADDPGLASLRALNPAANSRLAMALGGLLAGATGFAIGPVISAQPTIGLEYGLIGFVAMALGGFGSIVGALVGAAVLGVVQQLALTHVSGQFEDIITLALLAVVLLVRPSGLLGRGSLRSV